MPSRTFTGTCLATAVAVAGTALAGPAAAKIVPPSGGLPPGVNLVVCSEHSSMRYWVDGPNYRAGTLAPQQCEAHTVTPGTYTIGEQFVAWDEPHHFVSVIRPGGPRSVHQRTFVTTGVDAPPTSNPPTFGPVDEDNIPTGVNTPTSGKGINVTVVVFHDLSGASEGSGNSGTGSGGGSSSGGGVLTGPGGITCPPHPTEHCS